MEHVQDFDEFLVEMKINGREIPKDEEIAMLKKDVPVLKKIVKTAHHIKGRQAHDELKFLFGRIHKLEDELKIEELYKKMLNVRNAKAYDRISKQVDKLRAKVLKNDYF